MFSASISMDQIQDNKKRLQFSFKIITFSALIKSKENSQLGYANQYQHF